ncbi:substrate-binding domain-containing protein [Cochleicola gelatinilyticus]|uniref:ABC transporter substrate-binding protein n=1 Tax=Cochleicola gelatinilyticus TaxID=1763537 RepID=A0A167GW49_9FLAO|nr:substrate-binding domain-containing protein [Cochleicola gelatinilyticus]OAB77963.1 ABC transporter substrate-binding protein [Cochleicola gelatinilyticus]
MKNFKIGGVPEHFNLPWYLTLRDKEYQEEDINLRWKDYSGGTGEMCKALREGEIDMAVILTEGMVRDIVNGNPCKIVQVFVETPLLWGIHVAENSDYNSVKELKGTQAAISRYGSGSHLMAFVNAEQQGWNTEKDLDFTVIKNLDGALKNLPEGNGDYFMWEKFMTKPHVDNGTFRLVGECPTPWPCFVIAVRDEVLEKDEDAVKKIIEIINRTTSEFKDIPSIDVMIANRYELELKDVQKWLSLTEWSQSQLTDSQLEKIQTQLKKLQLIDDKINKNRVLHKF